MILCGGSGTRLWPLSREQYPKQLLSLVGDDTLLQATIRRITESELENQKMTIMSPVIITNENHRFLVAEQLRQINVTNPHILLEPQAKNTAPALTLGALHVQSLQSDALMLVMPADHVIKKSSELISAIEIGSDYAMKDALVTFGIEPQHAETGYGYIKKGETLGSQSNSISQFVEKPDLETAENYISTNQYVWNSGMFLFSANVWLCAIESFQPDIYEKCKLAYQKRQADLDFIRFDADVFGTCPSDSIDYAVMEKIAADQAENDSYKGIVVSMHAGWSDIGSWDSLWAIAEKDKQGNVLKGDVLLEDTKNSMVLAENRLVSVIGLSDIVVVETSDAIMVADKHASQSVKKIVQQLANDHRQETVIHRKVFRPWGSYESIDQGERFQVKRIVVNPGARLSLQMHHHRAEHWIVVTGTAMVTRNEENFLLSENESTYIPLGIKHRLENPGTIPLEIIEVQSGSYLGEDDIVRFQDEYGRNQ